MSDEIVKHKTEYNLTIVARLIEAFNTDYTIEAACRYAGISKTSYYNWLKDIDGFEQKMEEAQNKLSVRAGEVVTKAIDEGDVQTARWYKDRRDPRFKPKGELEVSPGQQDTEEKLKEFLDDTADGAYDEASGEPATPTEAVGGSEVAQSPQDIS